jgi:hypothetical protein
MYVNKANYLIHLGKNIEKLRKVAKAKEYREAVGRLGQEITLDWLNSMARHGGALGNRIPIFDWFRKNIGMAVLGYKLSTIAIQPTALLDGAAVIGHHAFTGLKEVTIGSSSKQWRKFLTDNFVEVRIRAGDDPGFAAYMRSDEGEGVLGAVKHGAFWSIRKVDGITASAIAAGAYIKEVKEKGGVVDLTKPDADAILEAETVVRRTQGSGLSKDLPSAISQGKFTGNTSVDKMMFQFQTFLLTRFALVQRVFSEQGLNLKPTKETINALTFLTLALFAEVFVRRGVEELIALGTGDEPDEPLKDVFFEKLLREALQGTPIVGQAVSAFKFQQVPIPVITFAQQGLRRANIAWDSKAGKKRRLELARAIFIFSGIFGVAPGASQVDQLLDGILDAEKKKHKSRSKRSLGRTR